MKLYEENIMINPSHYSTNLFKVLTAYLNFMMKRRMEMNTVTIKFGPGTAAWKDMQEVVKVLHDKGYRAQPYEDIGTIKLIKEIKDETK